MDSDLADGNRGGRPNVPKRENLLKKTYGGRLTSLPAEPKRAKRRNGEGGGFSRSQSRKKDTTNASDQSKRRGLWSKKTSRVQSNKPWLEAGRALRQNAVKMGGGTSSGKKNKAISFGR